MKLNDRITKLEQRFRIGDPYAHLTGEEIDARINELLGFDVADMTTGEIDALIAALRDSLTDDGVSHEH